MRGGQFESDGPLRRCPPSSVLLWRQWCPCRFWHVAPSSPPAVLMCLLTACRILCSFVGVSCHVLSDVFSRDVGSLCSHRREEGACQAQDPVAEHRTLRPGWSVGNGQNNRSGQRER
jgi:hypothetical protein